MFEYSSAITVLTTFCILTVHELGGYCPSQLLWANVYIIGVRLSSYSLGPDDKLEVHHVIFIPRLYGKDPTTNFWCVCCFPRPYTFNKWVDIIIRFSLEKIMLILVAPNGEWVLREESPPLQNMSNWQKCLHIFGERKVVIHVCDHDWLGSDEFLTVDLGDW